ncbi:MAG TPA: 3-deoxy-7-phosphoheptulonate synthase [Acidobacteria bacterium]|nr:3-deoxy-7-phosphoheptulonate synthase [Acidobacteriota bacterium]
MIIMFDPDTPLESVEAVEALARRFDDVTPKRYEYQGTAHAITEVHLLGSTQKVPAEPFRTFPGVRQVVRVSSRYRLVGRHDAPGMPTGFSYNGVRFDSQAVRVFAGLCAVDTPEHVDQTFAALASHGLETARMGAYKPRTSPYDFQGLGAACLPWVFELAGKHGIRVIAMEVTDARHIEEIDRALEATGRPTGVMIQIGTRNAQNFELLKRAGRQKTYPVLYKRGMGITLEESLNACEYIASEGNPNIVFCLRGVKTHLGDPHRNLVDFAHVPVVRRQTRMPVCIDPSHSVGSTRRAPDGLTDIFHVTGQGLIAGASMVLIDFHPAPATALCDGPQALTPDELPRLMAYVQRVRAAYDEVSTLAAEAETAK